MKIFDGRYNRAKYLYWIIAIDLLLIVIEWFIQYDPEMYKYKALLISTTAYSILALIPTVKRFHDLDLHGANAFLLFIPILNIYYFLVLLFKKGTEGENQFGADPLMEEKICSNCRKEILIDENEIDKGSFICPACNAVNMV